MRSTIVSGGVLAMLTAAAAAQTYTVAEAESLRLDDEFVEAFNAIIAGDLIRGGAGLIRCEHPTRTCL